MRISSFIWQEIVHLYLLKPAEKRKQQHKSYFTEEWAHSTAPNPFVIVDFKTLVFVTRYCELAITFFAIILLINGCLMLDGNFCIISLTTALPVTEQRSWKGNVVYLVFSSYVYYFLIYLLLEIKWWYSMSVHPSGGKAPGENPCIDTSCMLLNTDKFKHLKKK